MYIPSEFPFPFQVQVDPDDLIPKLPRPRDLHPFPTTLAIVREYCGNLNFDLTSPCRCTKVTRSVCVASALSPMASGWLQVGGA